ncbi:MAG: cyclic-di-AMP receptor [Bacillota bacterium]
MKLMVAIVNDRDAKAVNNALVQFGFRITRLASTGGFLRRGNTTFLIGVKDREVGTVVDLLKETARERPVMVPAGWGDSFEESVGEMVEVKEGGATIFVVPVEEMYRV